MKQYECGRTQPLFPEVRERWGGGGGGVEGKVERGLTGYPSLKVLSSEMDPAQIMLIR
jgi:hypothetical protein